MANFAKSRGVTMNNQKSLRNWRGVVAALVVGGCAVVGTQASFAADYVVDSTLSTPTDPNFKTLALLQDAHFKTTSTGNTSDSITFKNTDKTLTTALVMASGGTLTLASTKDVTIAAATTNGAKQFLQLGDTGGITVNAGSNLTIDGFKNSTATSTFVFGAIIAANATTPATPANFTLTNAGTLTFSKNTATATGNNVAAGGAISSTGTITISGAGTTIFDKNEANGVTGGYGGALAAISDITISGNNFFTGNKASHDGGAIFSDGNVTIENATAIFKENKATSGSAGAVYGKSVMLTGADTNGVKSIQFTSNEATVGGGAILIYSQTVKGGDNSITNATFTTNKATAANGQGGAIYIGNLHANVTNTIDKSIFTSNTAGKSGGAIYTSSQLTVTDTDFKNNTAGTVGGAIWTDSDLEIKATTKDVVFSGNITGAILNDIHLDKDTTTDITATFTAESGKTITLGGGITGDGSIEKNGVGTLIFAKGSINTYDGETKVNFGTLAIAGSLGTSTTSAADITVANGATIDLSGGTLYGSKLVIGGTYIDNKDSKVTLSDSAAFSQTNLTLFGSLTATEIAVAKNNGSYNGILTLAPSAKLKAITNTDLAINVEELHLTATTLGANAPIVIAANATVTIATGAKIYVLPENSDKIKVGAAENRYIANTATTLTYTANDLTSGSRLFTATPDSTDNNKISFARNDAQTAFTKISRGVADSLNTYAIGNKFLDKALNVPVNSDDNKNSEHIEAAYNAAGVAGSAAQSVSMTRQFGNIIHSRVTGSVQNNNLNVVNGNNGEEYRGQLPFAQGQLLTHTLWAAPIIAHQDARGLKSGGIEYGFSSDQYGGAFGYETQLGRSKYGVAFLLGGGMNVSPGIATHTTAESFFGGVTVYTSIPSGSYDLVTQMGWIGTENKVRQRTIDNDILNANVPGGAAFLSLLTEKTIRHSNLLITPSVGIEYTCVYQSDYKTHYTTGGAQHQNTFAAKAAAANMLVLPVGVKATTSWRDHKGLGYFTPEIGARFLPNVADQYINYANTPFSIPGAAPAHIRSYVSDQLAADTTMGLTWRGGCMETGFTYNALISEHFTNHNVGFLFKRTW